MKRVILSVFGTAAGVVALLSFKTHSPVTNAAGLPSAGLPGDGSSTASTPSAGSAGSTAAPTSGSSSSTSSASPATTSKSYLGQSVTTRYGIVQVKVTVAGSRITNVSFAQLQAFDGRSEQINSQAAPVLLQETLSAQSAQIDSVSGASYTSAGYVQSLQSALDQAGIK